MSSISLYCMVFCGSLLVASPALALEQHLPTDAELLSLPGFCKVKLRESGTPQERSLVAQFGRGNWIHLHHYCNGINYYNRAKRARKAQDRSYYLNVARGNLDYVVQHTLQDFYLRPHVYVELGNVYQDQGNVSEAVRYFEKAIEFDGKYYPAYSALIETFRKMGDRSAALNIATKGVRNLPENKALVDAYFQFGGQKPLPEPIVETEKNIAANPDDVHSEGTENPKTVSREGEDELQREEVPTKGCRFCPPEKIQERWRETFKDNN